MESSSTVRNGERASRESSSIRRCTDSALQVSSVCPLWPGNDVEQQIKDLQTETTVAHNEIALLKVRVICVVLALYTCTICVWKWRSRGYEYLTTPNTHSVMCKSVILPECVCICVCLHVCVHVCDCVHAMFRPA